MTETSKKATSQRAAILAHLKRHGSIDMPTAYREYGCAALRSRIADLRTQEIAIETRYVEFVSRFGHPGKQGYADFKFNKMINGKTIDVYAPNIFGMFDIFSYRKWSLKFLCGQCGATPTVQHDEEKNWHKCPVCKTTNIIDKTSPL